MSNQVGQIKTFSILGTVPAGSDITYVWRWWDGSVSVTKEQSVAKKLNVGGTLGYSCTAVSPHGEAQDHSSTIIVNSPPVFSGSPSLSANDKPFPFTPTITSKAYDPEGSGVAFKWFDGASYLGSGTTVVANGTGTNSFAYEATENKKLTLTVLDGYGTSSDAGTRRLDFGLRGFVASGPVASFSAVPNTLITSTANLPKTVIGPGQTVNFTAFASDPLAGSLTFVWSFTTANGWASNANSAGTSTTLVTGVIQNTLVKNVSAEAPGEKIAVCTVTNTTTGATTVIRSTVLLEQSYAPIVSTISTTATLSGLNLAVPLAGVVSYTGTASDANGDLVTYKWALTQPPAVLYGRTLLVKPSDYNSTSVVGREITGVLVVSDKFGMTGTQALPKVITA